MRNLVIIASGLALSSVAAWSGCAAAEPTLCNAEELVVFSCSTGSRIASVCASKNISQKAGHLQYRFGQKGKIELSYPATDAEPAKAFSSGTMSYSGGGGAWLRFSKGQFRYSIFTAIGKWGPSGRHATAEGVAIQKDGKDFANFPCRSPSESVLGPELFAKIGLKIAPPDEEFEIPEAFFPK